MIIAKGIKKSYLVDGQEAPVLKGIDLHVKKGEFLAIMGPSGSGKSTLLQLLGALDVPTSGELSIDGVPLAQMSDNERTLMRRRSMGFIFQNYQLLPTMTVAENIGFPLYADRASKSEVQSKITKLLQAVGLPDKASFFPSRLSGGQQQRVAIARALVTNPSVILADEPTGNLDRKRGTEILELLSKMHKEENLTIVMVTHDSFAAGYADRVIFLEDGMITKDWQNKEENHAVLADFMAKLNA